MSLHNIRDDIRKQNMHTTNFWVIKDVAVGQDKIIKRKIKSYRL